MSYGLAAPAGRHPLDDEHARREAAAELIADDIEAAMNDPEQVASDLLEGNLPLATALVVAWRHIDAATAGDAHAIRAVLEAVRQSESAALATLQEVY